MESKGPDPKDTVELLLPSELRFLGIVDAVVQSFASEFELEADDINAVSTAVIEAASNAMEHANKFAGSKRVVVRLRAQRNVVEVEVEDQGAGFDHRPYERELGAEDLLKMRGRGIFIMRSFMDDVRFVKMSGGGTRVQLRKVGKQPVKRADPKDVVREN